jgi:DegV family protein with EDD domain
LSATASELGAREFANAFRSGIHRVVSNQELLNRINVFPVADGDTGANLSLTLGAVLPVLERGAGREIGESRADIADALLDGARGNSGAIVAQFFQGVSDAAVGLAAFDASSFARAVARGADYASDALSNPREGTFLSVIRAFSNALESGGADVVMAETLPAAVSAAREALVRTTSQLEELRKAGVVDAGAQGFVELASGFNDHLVHGRVTEAPATLDPETPSAFVATEGVDDPLAWRFCVECILQAADIDRRKLRESLGELGDSLVLAGSRRKARVHIHVNEPDRVFETAARFGRVSGEKADDLVRQQRSTHGAGAKFAVITDSAADIADEELDRLDIHMVPVRIQFGERGYLDKVSITMTEFYRELGENPRHPTTSQPAPGDFRRQFQFLASHFPNVLSVNLTSRASGTLQAARAAADRIAAPGRVQVIDSRNASVGQGLIAVFAAECALAGLDVAAAVQAIELVRAQTFTFALVGNLDYAVRGGRVPRSRKLLANLLRAIPVLKTEADGRITAGGALFGQRHRLEKFAGHVLRRVDRRARLRIAIGHAICEDDAHVLQRLLLSALADVESARITDLGTAFGVHGGPGTLVVAVQYYP